MAATKYNKVFHPQLARWIVSFGYSDRELARELGVDPRTVKSWKDKHEEFAAAIHEGSESSTKKVESSLLKSAIGSDGLEVVEKVEGEDKNGKYSRTRSARVNPSLAAQKFWLQHRRPDRWRDTIADDDVVYDDVEFLT